MKYIYLSLLLIYSFSALAQWNTDTLVRNPVEISFSPEFNEGIVNDQNGGVYILISRTNHTTMARSIIIHNFDSAGYEFWPGGKTMIPASIGGFYNRIARPILLKGDSTGGWIIWESSGGPLSIQKFDDNGDTLFFPSKQFYPGFSNLSTLYAANDDSGGVIAIWEERGLNWVLKYMRIDKNGNNLIPNANTLISNINGFRGIAADNNNGAYYFYTESAVSHTYFAQHVGGNGQNSWTAPVTLTSNLGSGLLGNNICFDSVNNGCYFLYYDFFSDTYLQFINSSGTLRWSNGLLLHHNTFSGAFYSHDQVISDNAGGIFTAAFVSRSPDSLHDSYVIKHLDQSGNSLWNTADTLVISFPLSALTNNNTAPQNIVSDNNGGVIITWDEFRNGKLGIYAQHYDANGNKMWQSSGYPVITADSLSGHTGCNPTCDRLLHKTVNLGLNSAVTIWDDIRHGDESNTDVYASKVDGAIVLRVDDKGKLTQQTELFPVPAADKLFIKNLTEPSVITIYNNLGEKLRMNKSTSSEEIDIRNLAPGIYLVTIENKSNSFRKIFIKQ